MGFLLKGFKACKARPRKLSPHDDLRLQKSKKQMHAFFASLNETLRKKWITKVDSYIVSAQSTN